MKREFIKSLNIEGLTDEIIDKIMSENGKDIQKAQQAAEKINTELENLKAELKSKDELITNANSEIEKFKSLDVEGIKAQAEEWKNKYAEFESQTKAEKEAFAKQLAEKDYEFAVKEFTAQHKFTNDFVKDAFVETFKKQGFKLEDGKFLGAEDYIKTFGEKNPGVFITEEPNPDPVPQIVRPGGQNPPGDNKGFNFNFHTIRPVPKE
jgi:predicted metal-dependent phosphotriesterase family hydrolase